MCNPYLQYLIYREPQKVEGDEDEIQTCCDECGGMKDETKKI